MFYRLHCIASVNQSKLVVTGGVQGTEGFSKTTFFFDPIKPFDAPRPFDPSRFNRNTGTVEAA